MRRMQRRKADRKRRGSAIHQYGPTSNDMAAIYYFARCCRRRPGLRTHLQKRRERSRRKWWVHKTAIRLDSRRHRLALSCWACTAMKESCSNTRQRIRTAWCSPKAICSLEGPLTAAIP